MHIISFIFWFIIAALAVVFAVLNSYSVNVHYYFNSVQIYFPLLLLINIVIGVLLGVMAILPVLWRSKMLNRKLKNEQRLRK